jgi:hypothetical protein
MRHDPRRHRQILGFDRLEGRVLSSATIISGPRMARTALFARIPARNVSDASPGETAILAAINGGAGHEFASLIRKQASFSKIMAITAGFSSGAITEYRVVGAAFKIANLQPAYAGLPHDPLSLTVGGGVLLKGRKIELGMIVRGPFTTYPRATYIVFAIDRGTGARVGPTFASRPGITPDALVTVKVGPYGQGNSAVITDLTTGMTQSLRPPAIRVEGPVLRILVPASQLPTKGLPISKYRFAIWSQLEPAGGIENVGSFLPEATMIPIGVETNVRPPKF